MLSVDESSSCKSSVPLIDLMTAFLSCRPDMDSRDRNNLKRAFSILLEFFPDIHSDNLTAKSFRRFQDFLIDKRYDRCYINKLMKFIRSVLRWSVVEELISSHDALAVFQVPAVRHGRSRCNAPRREVPDSHIDAVLSYLPEPIVDMVKLQRLSGMRPSEICRMTVGTLDLSRDVDTWLYVPVRHKTEWFGKQRLIWLGKAEQQILNKYADWSNPDVPIFRNRLNRPFTTATFGRCIQRTIVRHGLPKFTSYQIRHRVATAVSLVHGRDAARAVLGHSSDSTTSIYDHGDMEKSLFVVKRGF